MATFGSSVSRLPRSLFFQLLRSLIFRLLVERCRKMLEAQFSSFLIKKLAASLFFRHQKPGCQLENKATSLVFELLRSLLFRLQALFSGCKPKKQASRRIWVRGPEMVEKWHAAVAPSTFTSQNVQNTCVLHHFWRLTN